ncbi:MAG: hypothetical protein K6G00_07640 [Treponema sp.]|nr:hypothetical protein [Treponema sp.]
MENHLKIKEIHSQINRVTGYGENSFDKYVATPAVWNFVEMVAFAGFISFYDGRMVYRKQYFENNTDIKNAYHFARTVLDYYSGK